MNNLCNNCKKKKDCKHKKIFIRAQNFIDIEQDKKNKENILYVTCKNYEL